MRAQSCARLLALLPVLGTLTLASALPSPSASTAECLSLDAGWRFHLGDIPFPDIKGHGITYANAKAGKAWGAAAPEYDDTDWRELNLPHDWAIESPFDENENISQGYRSRGYGWYRRNFTLNESDRGRHLELKFDGIATYATIWVNGLLVQRNWCGYTSFSVDLTPFAKYGDELNNIAIRVDANAQEGWWYEGAGIYRHTWLIKRPATHIVTDGVFAQPVRDPAGHWSIPVEVTIGNDGRAPAPLEIESVLLDPDGQPIAQAKTTVTAEMLKPSGGRFTIQVTGEPRLWSVDDPVLYQVRTTLNMQGVLIDSVTTTAGFRTLRFDADHGFFLNDLPLKLKGTCNHQDHAGVGVAVPDSLWEFRIRRLKEMGSNAYRCAHNPPAKEFLDACDRLGMLVLDENRNFNSSPEHVRQLEWLVRRDRNHPSVILWSIFNEEPMQGTEIGYEMVRRLASAVKQLDPTRPITAAMNGGFDAPVSVAQAVDVVGFNYQHKDYDRFHQAHPLVPLTSSEDTSAFMTRGVFEDVPGSMQASSYDTQSAAWGLTHHQAWKEIAQRPFLAGGFVWTGFDYRGEPQKFSWPSVSSVFGILDVCGFPKTAYYIHQAGWLDDRPILHLAPHWNWAGREGQPIKVLALTNGDAVELFLNGRSLGKKLVDRLEGAEWNVPYTPGTLSAVAYQSGHESARFAVETTGAPFAIKLTLDRPALADDGWDAQPITVSAVDAQGRTVPTASLPITFALEGPGEIIGHGNGDNTSHEPEKGNERRLFNGLAQVIIQSRRIGPGPITLTASSPGITPATAQISIRPVPAIPSVPTVQPTIILEKWRRSPGSVMRPDPNVVLSDNDQNSWAPVQAGHLTRLEHGAYMTYRADFKPFKAQQAVGGQLRFRSITGRVEIWIDGQLAARKATPEAAALVAPFPPGEKPRTVNVLIEGQPEQAVGLGGIVLVEARQP